MFFLVILVVCLRSSARNISVNYYDDENCINYVNSITYDMGDCDPVSGLCDQECYSVQGQSYSAHQFECYEDWGILFSLYMESDACSSLQPQHKETRVGCCIVEPSGFLWSYIPLENAPMLNGCSPKPNTLPCIDDCTVIEDLTEAYTVECDSIDSGARHESLLTGGYSCKNMIPDVPS